MIESTGISEPMPVAETFTFEDENGISLSDVARLDTMVTLIDAVNFLKDYDEAKYLNDTGESLGEDDHRTIADLLIEQIEFADITFITKCDLVDEATVKRLTTILKKLNTHAKIIPIKHGKLPINTVLNTNLFSFEKLKKLLDGSRKLEVNILLKLRNMELVVLYIRQGNLFILRNFMIFYTMKFFLES